MAHPEPPAGGHPGAATDPTAGVAEIASSLLAAGDTGDTLQRVVDLAVETVDGCDHAGIFLAIGGTLATPVHTDQIVVDVDTIQHRAGEGPCLDAIAEGGAVYAEELRGSTRWPVFAPLAAAAGVRSVLALRLAANGTRGALNLYARYPQAFGIVDRARALILATLAGVVLSSAEAHDADTARAENLQSALVTRELIGQAEGILMERERITADQAFDILRRASQHLNVKLRDIARNLVETGEAPDKGPPRTPADSPPG
jgi:hypothetical protein